MSLSKRMLAYNLEPMTICPDSAPTPKVAGLKGGPSWATILGSTVLMGWGQNGKQPYCKWSLCLKQTSKPGLLITTHILLYIWKIPLHSAPQAKDLVSLCVKCCLLLYTPCIPLSVSAKLSLTSALESEFIPRADLACLPLVNCWPSHLTPVCNNKSQLPSSLSPVLQFWVRYLHLWRHSSNGRPYMQCLCLINQKLTNVELSLLTFWFKKIYGQRNP